MKNAVFAAIATLVAAPAFAQGTQPYSYTVPTVAYTGNSANYCPAGLQPVMGLDGISCGRPTMAGPAAAAPRPMLAKPAAPVEASAVTPTPPAAYEPDTIMMGGN
ncbi:MAG: hypothetical protein EP336_12475 [Rhodobacteraceae bacterium]|nr:MAG: hypothetical protein EP336_12475 [Paracoccaceae bacterium]